MNMKISTVAALLILSGCGSTLSKSDFAFAPDKGQHFVMGAGVAAGTRLIATEYTTWTRKEVMIAGCAAAATVGVTKEVSDSHMPNNRFDIADAVYTAAGCLLTFEWVF